MHCRRSRRDTPHPRITASNHTTPSNHNLKPRRLALQVLHENGPFGCHGKEKYILGYNGAISRALDATGGQHGAFGTVVVDWNEHSWDLMSKSAVTAAWREYVAGRTPSLDRLPCDILHHNATVVLCPWAPPTLEGSAASAGATAGPGPKRVKTISVRGS